MSQSLPINRRKVRPTHQVAVQPQLSKF